MIDQLITACEALTDQNQHTECAMKIARYFRFNAIHDELAAMRRRELKTLNVSREDSAARDALSRVMAREISAKWPQLFRKLREACLMNHFEAVRAEVQS